MKFPIGVCCVMLGVMSAPASASPKQENDRMAVIMNSVQNRFTDQLDSWFVDGDYPRCVQLLKLAFLVDPHDYDTATNLGWMLQNVEKHDEALAIYVRFTKENPALADAPWPEANFYFNRKLYAKVPPLLEPSLKLKPHPNTYRTLAHAYDRLGMLADAKRVWEAYIAINPTDEAAKANLKKVDDKIAKGGGLSRKS